MRIVVVLMLIFLNLFNIIDGCATEVMLSTGYFEEVSPLYAHIRLLSPSTCLYTKILTVSIASIAYLYVYRRAKSLAERFQIEAVLLAMMLIFAVATISNAVQIEITRRFMLLSSGRA